MLNAANLLEPSIQMLWFIDIGRRIDEIIDAFVVADVRRDLLVSIMGGNSPLFARSELPWQRLVIRILRVRVICRLSSRIVAIVGLIE